MERRTDRRQSSGFGERLRALRRAKGWNQQELGSQAGCAMSTIAKLERGQQEPGWPLALLLAEALGCDLNDFLPAARAKARRR